MVALEAAACGLPVVGTRVGVIPELTKAVSPVGDAEALGEAVARSLAEPSVLISPTQLRARFGLDACANRFRELYTTLSGA